MMIFVDAINAQFQEYKFNREVYYQNQLKLKKRKIWKKLL